VRKMRCKAKAIPGAFELGFSSNNNEQIGVRVQLIGGEFDGQSMTWYGTFTPASEERTIEQLQIAGWNGEDFLSLPGLGSTEFELQLEEQEPQGGGAPYWKPTFINRLGVAMKNPMNDAEKRTFAQRVQALARPVGGAPKSGSGGGARQPARPQQQSGGRRQQSDYADNAPPHSDDDIPF
jgi:hypothetical protein